VPLLTTYNKQRHTKTHFSKRGGDCIWDKKCVTASISGTSRFRAWCISIVWNLSDFQQNFPENKVQAKDVHYFQNWNMLTLS